MSDVDPTPDAPTDAEHRRERLERDAPDVLITDHDRTRRLRDEP